MQAPLKMRTAAMDDALWSGSNDLWIGAWSLEHHGGAERLGREVEVFASHVKSARPGDPNRPVLLPGEAEIRSREHRLAEGIPIEDATWAALAEKAKALGVPLPETMAGSVSSDATWCSIGLAEGADRPPRLTAAARRGSTTPVKSMPEDSLTARGLRCIMVTYAADLIRIPERFR